MPELPTFDELRRRIHVDIDHFHGELPERTALVWHGYLAALNEWSLISVSEYDRLCDMLPQYEDNPIIAIALGRPDSQSQ